MSRRRRTLTVWVQWHDVAWGLWCDACALPSKVRWAMINVATLNVLSRVEQCTDCGHVEALR